MNEPQETSNLRTIVAELDAIRRSLMADQARREIYLQVVQAQHHAEDLLAQAEAVGSSLPVAAE